MFPKSRFMFLFAVLGPFHPPYTCSQSRGLCCYSRFCGTWALPPSPHNVTYVPKTRFTFYLQYLGLIALPTNAPKVAVHGVIVSASRGPPGLGFLQTFCAKPRRILDNPEPILMVSGSFLGSRLVPCTT